MLNIRRMGAFKPWGAAVSAIEIALWDIAGQVAGVPVYKLLGERFATEFVPTMGPCVSPRTAKRPLTMPRTRRRSRNPRKGKASPIARIIWRVHHGERRRRQRQAGPLDTGEDIVPRRREAVARASVPESKSGNLCLAYILPCLRVLRNPQCLGHIIVAWRQQSKRPPLASQFLPSFGQYILGTLSTHGEGCLSALFGLL
jgi:Mandelate racemase / muconate lactonizing enzyme, N-terminal domain